MQTYTEEELLSIRREEFFILVGLQITIINAKR